MSISIYDDILACLPNLRGFVRAPNGNRDQADDLVQDAILRALSAAGRFTRGTNFKAWIFTILRDHYFNEFHNRARIRPLEVADIEAYATAPAQHAGLEFDDLRRALNMLPVEQREALVLVGADDFRYEESAAICGCPVGTIKGRVGPGAERTQKAAWCRCRRVARPNELAAADRPDALARGEVACAVE